MTTQVEANSQPQVETEEKDNLKPSQNKVQNNEPSDKPEQIKSEQETPSKPESTGVFGGWGFDVNAVAGNWGGLFSAADPSVPDDVAARSPDEPDPTEDIGAKAATIAKTATVELEHASKAAQQTIGKAAEEIGKGWGTLNTFLDDMLAAKPDAGKADPESDADALNQFQQLFPELEGDGEVVDHFKCCLLQKYRCYLNNATPEKTYVLRGRLFVSTANIAMHVTDDRGEFGGQPFGISMPFTDIAKIQKGAKAMIRVVTKSQSSLIFGHFESDSHFSGALSLLEHMVESAAQSPAKAEPEAEEEKKQAAG